MTSTSAAAISVTPGHNEVRVEVTSGSAVKIVDLDIVVASNLLSNLTLNSGTLSPSFDSGTAAYTVNYESGTTGTIVTATTLTTGASVTVNAIATSSAAITLSTGVNTIDVVVTAEDNTSKTYTIMATVAASPVDPLQIVSIQGINDITVPYGTAQNSINFPQAVNVVLSTSSTTSSNVVWSSSTPVYNSTTSGTYVFSGDIIKKLEQGQFDVVIKKKNISYKIPAKEFTINSIANKLILLFNKHIIP